MSADVLPPDRADTNPLDSALRDLLQAVRGERSTGLPRITVTLERAEWDKARTYYQRPYRPRPLREFAVSLAEGMVWVELAEPKAEEQPSRAGYLCPHGNVERGDGWRCRECVAAEQAPPTLDGSRPKALEGVTDAEVREALGPALTPRWARLVETAGTVADAGVLASREAVTNPALEGMAASAGAARASAATEATYGGPWVAPEDRR